MEPRPIAPTLNDPALAAAGRTPARAAAVDPKIKQAAQAFEAHFIAALLEQMRKTVPQGGLFGNGPGASTYQWLMDQQLAQAMAAQGGLGLARSIEQRYDAAPAAGAQVTPPANR